MIRLRTLAASLARDAKGVTLVEFAFVAPVMILMLVGGFDLAHQSYIKAVLQGALNDAARRAAVEDPVFEAEGDTTEERVEAVVRRRVDPITPGATIEITQRNFFDFTAIGNPEKLMTDKNDNGQYDAAEGDCFADFNEDGEYTTDIDDTGLEGIGGANEVVFYRATVTMPRLVPLDRLLNLAPEYHLAAETAIRNQPYATQKTPPVVCGDDE